MYLDIGTTPFVSGFGADTASGRRWLRCQGSCDRSSARRLFGTETEPRRRRQRDVLETRSAPWLSAGCSAVGCNQLVVSEDDGPTDQLRLIDRLEVLHGF